MRILEVERRVLTKKLVAKFDVTDRTIRKDIAVLTVKYPIKTVRGRNGYVMLLDWYHPHRNILSRDHQTTLIKAISQVDEPEKTGLKGILNAFGSPAFIKEVTGEDFQL